MLVCVWSWVDAGKVIHLCSLLLPSAFGPAALLWSSRMRECSAERFPSRLVPVRIRTSFCTETRLSHDATVTSSVLRGCVLMRGWVLISASGRASKFLSAPMPKPKKKKSKHYLTTPRSSSWLAERAKRRQMQLSLTLALTQQVNPVQAG